MSDTLRLESIDQLKGLLASGIDEIQPIDPEADEKNDKGKDEPLKV